MLTSQFTIFGWVDFSAVATAREKYYSAYSEEILATFFENWTKESNLEPILINY